MNSDFNRRVFEIYNVVHALKRLPRAGWLRHPIEDSESVADHVFGVALLTLIYAPERDVDAQKALTIALIHELGEAVIGDLTPLDTDQLDAKAEREDQATREILSHFTEAEALLELWRDFHEQRTPEGRLVKELDRLEMALQAHFYERDSDGKRGEALELTEFYSYVQERIESEEVISLFNEILARRKKRD